MLLAKVALLQHRARSELEGARSGLSGAASGGGLDDPGVAAALRRFCAAASGCGEGEFRALSRREYGEAALRLCKALSATFDASETETSVDEDWLLECGGDECHEI
jgi:hypothetical protein